ncbi:unnamed protein product [Blepharisma stoltei]|uniref:Major facilitator superfamily (MFS) profile domain-containing protein n=1 Tax=Blepharisma stoltei TaxID=1481888 RepID=A0AAU9K154_9CILI|nr:unnamed protein product [Blepharisma stoltei]
MKRVSVVERALEDIGWGKYHNFLFLNCCCGWLTALMWQSAVANVMAEYPDLSLFEYTMLGISVSAGSAAGAVLFSSLSDRYGRGYIFKKIIILTSISALALILSANYVMVFISVFFVGLGTGGDVVCPPPVMIESTPPSRRGIIAVMNIGYCIGPLLAQISSLLLSLYWDTSIMARWRILAICIFVLTVGFMIMRQYIYESPIFLFGNDNEEFLKVIGRIAKENERFSFETRAPLLVNKQATSDENRVKTHLPFIEIFRGRNLKPTILLTSSISLFNFSFNGIMLFLPAFLQVDSMGLRYTIIGIQQFAGIIGLFVAMKTVDSKIGRRYTMGGGYLIGGILLLMFLFSTELNFIIILAVAYYFFQMMGVAGKNLIGAESFGPQIRGKALGFIYLVARIAAVLSPVVSGFLLDISDGNKLLPLASFAIGLMLSGVTASFLDETRPNLVKK